MNTANPLDINYLDRSIESQERSFLVQSAQIEDIPEVYKRLYEDSLRKNNRQN